MLAPCFRFMGITVMLFDEFYGSTYNIVADVLRKAVNGDLDITRLRELTSRDGGGKGAGIRSALEKGLWPLLFPDGRSAIGRVPDIPPTELELRWLKTICEDPRVKLFLPDGFEEDPDFARVEPLYTREFFVYYDRYADSDPYEYPAYVKNIRLIVQAIKEKRAVVIVYQGKSGIFSKKFFYVEEDCWIQLKISAAGLRLINKVGLDAALKQAVAKGYVDWKDIKVIGD